MKLNYNSFSSKLYRWIYYTDDMEMPTNLCPYFWKLVVAYIIALPVLVLTLPIELIRLFVKDKEKMEAPLITRIFMSVIFAFALLFIAAVLAPISLFFGYTPIEDSSIEHLISGGIFIWVVGIIFAIGYGIKYLYDRHKNRRKNISTSDETEKSNIVVEFVKAKYNKYCPKIEWTNKK